MCADAPRPNGDFANGLRGRQNFVSQTQDLRTNEAVPATDRNVALRNQLSKLEREKKRPLSVSADGNLDKQLMVLKFGTRPPG